ncbi:MAG: sodium:calcium antiporter [Candidatus Marsarchaeota archaeon]|nr:sodium:calcium antiporter [Candidatus Marsarchaeota archaeon]
MILAELLVLLAALAVLGKSSGIVVEKAAKLSAFFGISTLAIGFILISVSTSLPELSVSVLSSASGNGAISAGNVFGSNIANILLVLGLAAFLYGFSVKRTELLDIGLVLVLTTLISAYIIYAASVSQRALAFPEGLVLLGLFGTYVYSVLRRRKTAEASGERVSKKEALEAFLWFFAAILIVLASAGFVVEAAIKLADELGLAESFIGATLVAVGTSLPELSVDLQAIRKRQYGLALGDAIGSNMTNLTLVLGTAAVINPITITLPIFIIALLFAITANILLFYGAATDRRLHRPAGLLFLAMYGAYLVIIFLAQAKSAIGW